MILDVPAPLHDPPDTTMDDCPDVPYIYISLGSRRQTCSCNGVFAVAYYNLKVGGASVVIVVNLSCALRVRSAAAPSSSSSTRNDEVTVAASGDDAGEGAVS